MNDNKSNSLQQSQDSKKWTIADSERLYNIPGWGKPYFSINVPGNLAVNLKFAFPEKTLDLYELVRSLAECGLKLPILIHFPDILADRIAKLYGCMNEAIAKMSQCLL